MSSSSSSDSEDNDRFKAACDPTFVLHFENNSSRVTCKDERNEEKPTESRKSFILANQLLKLIPTWKSGTGNKFNGPHYEAESHRPMASNSSCTSTKRKNNAVQNKGAPSAAIPYISKQLAMLLDKKVEIEENEDKEKIEDVKRGQLYLVKDRPINSFSKNESDVSVKRSQKKIRTEKYDKKEVSLRCKSVALPPEHFLKKVDVYPWPDPKNVRYLDRLKLKTKRKDGTIEAIPFDANYETIKNSMQEQQMKTPNRMDVTQNGRKDDNGVNMKKEGIADGKQSENNQNSSENIENKEKSGKKSVNKQKARKRSGKKHKKKIAVTHVSDPCS